MTRDQYIKAASVVRNIDEASYLLKGIHNKDAIRISVGTHTMQLNTPCAISADYYTDCHKAIVKALEDYRAALQQELAQI